MLERIQVTTTGSAGSATGSQTNSFLLRGYLQGVRFEYSGVPATTVVTITEVEGLKRVLIVSPATATAAPYNPQALVNKPDGTSAAMYWPFYLDGVHVTVSVATSDAAANGVTAFLVIAENYQ
jgi:hypothetical protein